MLSDKRAGPVPRRKNDLGIKHVRHLTKPQPAGGCAPNAPASAGWEPTKPVEIVVAAGAGGAPTDGADDAGRDPEEQSDEEPMVVSLKGGASAPRR